MTLLNQVIAVVPAKKKLATEALTAVYHAIQKPELFNGLARTYTPRDEEGEQLPPEGNKIQKTVGAEIDSVLKPLTDMLDVVFAQDCANTEAYADVSVDGKIIAQDVPVTHLLFLEKQLTDLTTFVSKLPVLDPTETWTWNDTVGAYSSQPTDKIRTKKISKPFVKAEATDKHPAQVDVVTEDINVGTWRAIKFSGAMKASDKAAMLDRVRKLHEAVVKAREECNSKTIQPVQIGESILNYVFNNR